MEPAIIKQFADLKSKKKATNFYEKALKIVTKALEEASQEVKTITPETTRVFPIGEFSSDTYIDEVGEIELVVASCEPQIILANKVFIKNYNETKNKKEKKLISTKGTSHDVIFAIFNKLIPYFDETTMLLVTDAGIKVLCNKEYDFKILIRFGTYDQDDEDCKINIWNPISKNQNLVDIFAYHEAMDKKDKDTNGNYKKIVRILKNTRKNILLNKLAHSNEINKYLVELVAYNIPNSLLKGKDIYEVLVKSMLYLSNCNINKLQDFNGKSIRSFSLARVNFSNIRSFLNYSNNLIFYS